MQWQKACEQKSQVQQEQQISQRKRQVKCERQRRPLSRRKFCKLSKTNNDFARIGKRLGNAEYSMADSAKEKAG